MPSGVLFIHNLRLVPLEQQTTRFRKALAQKAFALDTVGSFSTLCVAFSILIEKLHTYLWSSSFLFTPAAQFFNLN